MTATNNGERTSKVKISVVLEYQWTSTRDLIENVEVDQYSQVTSMPATRMESPANADNFNGDEEAKKQSLFDSEEIKQEEDDMATKVSSEISLKSVMQGLENVGFDLEPDHRISFHHPDKKLYVYVGKVCDQHTVNRFRFPKEAFSEYGKSSQLTLMIREAGTGLSAKKDQENQVANALTEHLRKNLFAQTFPENKTGDEVESGLAKTNKFAQQTHALLTAQSFPNQSLPAGIEGLPNLQRALSQTSDPQKDQNVSNEKKKPAADEYCIHENKRTKERQIRYVVERVSLWRKLYNGVDLGNGETVRYSLEDSARLVGISKKSLDDYLLQLRFGRMYGFDFLKHQCDNIGQLRKFVREHKNKQRHKTKSSAASTADPSRTVIQSTNAINFTKAAQDAEDAENEMIIDNDNDSDKTEEQKVDDEGDHDNVNLEAMKPIELAQ